MAVGVTPMAVGVTPMAVGLTPMAVGVTPVGAATAGGTPDASELGSQLRLHLASNHARVLDLFREMDVDGGGTVRKVESLACSHFPHILDELRRCPECIPQTS